MNTSEKKLMESIDATDFAGKQFKIAIKQLTGQELSTAPVKYKLFDSEELVWAVLIDDKIYMWYN